MKKNRLFKAVGALAAAALVSIGVAACSPDSIGSSSHSDSDKPVITVGTLKGQPHLFQPYFYQQFIDDATVKVVTFDSSPDIKNAIVSGAIDYGVVGAPAVISGAAQGDDVQIVASAADGGSGFVARDGISSTADLKGKKIGYPQGSSQEILLKLTLANLGIPTSSVELVNLPFADMATALSSSRVDAFLSAENGPATAIVAGAHSIASPYDTPIGKVNIVLATKKSTVESKKDQTAQIVRAHEQAVDYMQAHTDEWSDGLVKQFGLDKAVADQAIKNVWPRSALDPDYVNHLTALVQQMKDINQISSTPETSAFVDTEFVQK